MIKHLTTLLVFIFITTTYIKSQTIPTNGLVAWYPFTGNAIDSSGNGNNGTVQGAVLCADRFNSTGKAYTFYSSPGSGPIILPSIVLGKSFTINVWVNLNQFNSGNVSSIFSKYPSAGNGYEINIDNNNPLPGGRGIYGLIGSESISSNSIITNYPYGLNSWDMITWIKDSSYSAFYLDNKLIYRTNSASINTGSNTGAAYFGKSQWGGNPFKGKLDDIRIYNRALDSTEIKILYQEGGWGNSKITSFKPISATLGTTDTIKGKGFTGATKVSFGGTTATSFNVLNDSTITAVVGNGTSGKVYVNNSNGIVDSLDGFIYCLPTKTNITKIACASYSWHGTTYTSSGIYTFDSLNIAGCDSLTTLNLTINQPSVSSTNLTIYSNQLPFSWNGLTFNVAGTQTAHILNAGGCDSATTLNLTVVPSQPKTLFISQQNVCNSGTVTVPVYLKNIKRVTGFQGSINFDKAILRYSSITGGIGNISPSTADTANGRIGFMWVDPLLAGQNYADSTIAFSVKFTVAPNYTGKTGLSFGALPTALEIDTVAAGTGLAHATTDTAFKGGYVNFTGRTNGSSNSATICPSALPFKWNGLTFNTSGTQTAHFTNVTGCDSAATMVLTVKPNATTNTVNVSGCNSLVYKSKIYTASTIVRDTVKSAMGCDSIYNVGNIKVTTIIPATNYVPLSACNKLVYKGITYYNSGVATDTVKSYQGCDSVYNILLITINTITPKTNSSSISGCNSVSFRSVNYTSSAIITDTVKSYQGCDSVYNVTQITVNKIVVKQNAIPLSGCNSVLYKGVTYTATTIVRDTVKSYQGCDSIYNIGNLIILNITPITQNTILTGCDSLWFNGYKYQSDTTLFDTVKSGQGIKDTIYNASAVFSNITNRAQVNLTGWLNIAEVSSVYYTGHIDTSGKFASISAYKAPSYPITSWLISPAISIPYKTPPYLNFNCIYGYDNGATFGVYISTNYDGKSLNPSKATWTKLPYVAPSGALNGYSTLIPSGNIDLSLYEGETIYIGFRYDGSVSQNTTFMIDAPKIFYNKNAIGFCDSIYKVSTIKINKFNPVTIDTSINSNCNNIIFNNNTYNSSIKIMDTIRTIRGCDSIYLTAYLNIINNVISGGIKHPTKGYAIQNVTAYLKGNLNDSTIGTGKYSFGCIPVVSKESVLLYKDNDLYKANGVTTLDIAQIQSHILGKSLLNSPYKIIAADVNGDGKVSTLDIVYMKRLILGIDTTFVYGTGKNKRLWAFIDSSYKFPDTTNPFPFKDSISYYQINTSKNNQTFIGCKLGDVNWDWNPAIPKPMINNTNAVELSYQSVLSGRASDGYIRIPIKVKNFKEMLGMQFTISFDPSVMQWQEIANNQLRIETGINHAEEGKISFLWVDAKNEIKTLEDGSVIMELVFKTINPLNNVTLNLDGSVTAIAAYDKDYNLHNVVLKSSQQNISESAVQQFTITPNPSKDHIIINGNNIKTLKLIDINGRVVKIINPVSNCTSININGISNGLYFIQAKYTNGSIQTEKLIKE